VPGVSIHWGKPQQQELRKVPPVELERYLAEGQFPAGSMGPKVRPSFSSTEPPAAGGHLPPAGHRAGGCGRNGDGSGLGSAVACRPARPEKME
jgi:hypothetical protein